jgi:prepilin-type N-terminal cleavage/methylation domain-containing protein
MKNTQRTMNYEQRTYKAFTLIELVVAVALLAIVFAFAGTIFKVSINAYRTAVANAEIIQKLRAITDQLNADFKGLRKDGEIFVIWKASKLDAAAAQYDDYCDCDNDGYERFDRIMFFADGDFQSYEPYKNGKPDPSGEPIRGSVARICYMLANKPPANIGAAPPERPENYNDLSLTEIGRKHRKEKRRGRILSMTQHILTADAQFAGSQTPDGTSSLPDWYNWNDVNEYDYDMNSLDKWKNIPWPNKKEILSVITDITVQPPGVVSENIRGTMVDPNRPDTIHNLFCEGVGEFKVQGWYDAGKRWVPEVDPNGNGVLTDDSDFFLNGSEIDPIKVPGVLYPYRVLPPPDVPYGEVNLGGVFTGNDFQELLNEAKFDSIPGLGRALKFTFTLYDSKGVFKEGREFTHIVYLGE